MSVVLSNSLEVYSGLAISNSFEVSIVANLLAPVPVPQNLEVTITGYNADPLNYITSVTWDAPISAVDSYQWRASNNLEWDGIGNRNFSWIFLTNSSWIEIRSVKEGRTSSPVRVEFSDFIFPAINAPTGVTVEITSHSDSRTDFIVRYNEPTNAWGRTVSYHIDRSNFGILTESDTESSGALIDHYQM